MRKKSKIAKYSFNTNDFSAEELFALKSMYTGLFAQKMFDYLGDEGISSILGDTIESAE